MILVTDGGSDSGAIGKYSQEKNIALAVAKKLERALQDAGIQVMLTRTSDTDVAYHNATAYDELSARALVANDAEADFFISIHCNGFSKQEAQGFEIWTTKGQTDSDPLAELIYNNIVNGVGMVGRNDYTDGDADREENYIVLRLTNMAAVLVELGFITNKEDEARMNNEAWQWRIVYAIRDAVTAWRGESAVVDIAIQPEETPLESNPGESDHIRGDAEIVENKDDWSDAGLRNKMSERE